MDGVADLDPTGVLPAVAAGIRLVGVVARVTPSVIKGAEAMRDKMGQSGGADGTSRGFNPGAQSGPFPLDSLSKVDPERERRAYETVNFVLRTLGHRIGEAGLVSTTALAKALTGATTHIEVKLFSVEANRIFESLTSKLNDPILVYNVFTSIYFIGALTAELSNTLPNYKESYVSIGPRICQQLFRAAIGEDAFRENLTANLDALKNLATTAGLLRPTDIGYGVFPGNLISS